MPLFYATLFFRKQDVLAAWSHSRRTGLHATNEYADAWLADRNPQLISRGS